MAAALALLTFAVFAPSLRNGYVDFDDPQYVFENLRVQQGLTLDNVRWAFTTGYFSNWHPLTWLSYMLDYELFGLAPWGYHLVNVLFHAANAGLLVLALTRLTGAPVLALVAAAFFAIHPLRVESVAWIAERKDVLSGFFGILCLLAYANYVKAPSKIRYALVALWLALGLMAKPMLVTWPCVLLLLDYWPLRRIPSLRDARAFGRCAAEKLPLFALAAASSVATFFAQRGQAMVSLDEFPLSVRLANAPVAYARYVANTVWPSGLAAHYAHPGHGLTAAQVAAAVLALLVLTLAALLAIRRAPFAIVGWLWFVGTLVPVIGLVQVGSASMADRYTYLPAIGLAVAVVWLAAAAAARWPRTRPALAAAAVALLAVHAALTIRQIAVWRDSESLYTRALAVDPRNAMVHHFLGAWYVDEGRIPEARARFEQALLIAPNLHLALNALGVLYRDQGLRAEAERLFRASIDANPRGGTAYGNLGELLAQTGRVEEAIEYLRKALTLIPRDDPNHTAVANYIPQLEEWLRLNRPAGAPAP